MNDAERWIRVKEIFDATLERPPSERSAFLREDCGDNDLLRTTVQSLLTAHDQSHEFFQQPAVHVLEEWGRMEPGDQVGPYKVIEFLGSGGMGEVYRARDVTLGREIALKILPPFFAGDPDRLVRFEREARLLAALNHPHVGAIYGFEEAHGTRALALELVDGATLADRLSSGALRIEDALTIARQIADALGAAHAKRIVHRDLKPANIKITPEGVVKVLDFGLAKAHVEESSGSDLSQGIILGTAAYMSPEQARAKPVDERTDIWAFGCVLYEMLAGHTPFGGETVSDTIAAILTREPDWRALPESTPERVRDLLRRCLEKDMGRRLRDISTARTEIEEIRLGSQINHAAQREPSGRRPRARVAFLALVTIFGLLGVWRFGSRTDESGARRDITTPPRIQSLVVLPLENLSGDPSQEYFADGMTEELTTRLSKIGGLTVISRGTAMQFKGMRKPIPEIAKHLGVQVVVAGSVAQSIDRVRITVQLIDATDRNLWAERYDRPNTDLLAIQAEVASAIAREIRTTVSPQDQKRLAAWRAVAPEAYESYLRGKFYAGRRSKEDNLQQIGFFERAIAADPQFAAARAELGRAYAQRFFFYSPSEVQLQERAFVEIERALAIDPDLAVAHEAKGELLWQPWNRFPHDRAIAEYRRAIELNPSADEARHLLGTVYLHVGLLDEGLREIQEAIRINPDNRLNRFREGVAYLYLGQYSTALDIFSKTPPDLTPFGLANGLGETLFHLGRREEAAATLVGYLAKNPTDPGGLATGIQAMLEADAGRVSRVEELIAISEEKAKGVGHAHHTMYHIARAYALLRRPSDAVTWLRRSADDGFPCYTLFANDPAFDRIRANRTFQEFLAQQRKTWEGFKKLAG